MSHARELYKQSFDHFANGRLEEAISGFQRCVELDPQLSLAWNGLAMALARNGNPGEAIEAGRKLVELDPDEPLSHTSLSMFYQQAGMIAEAEAEKAIAAQLTMRRQNGS
jgi:Flp pilus assembly protein TadD